MAKRGGKAAKKGGGKGVKKRLQKGAGKGAKKPLQKGKGAAGTAGKRLGQGRTGKGSGKGGKGGAGKGPEKTEQGEKATTQAEDARAKRGTKRVAPGKDEKQDDGKKKKITVRRARRKELTSLYAELINPGTEKKVDVVERMLKILYERPTPLSEYCCKEIGSRIVQACLKWGSSEHRRSLLSALREHLAKLAVDRYGHIVVLKLLSYATRTSTQRAPTEDQKKARAQVAREVLEAFRGKDLHATFYHRCGCKVINALYFADAVKVKEKRRLFQELAVPPLVSATRTEQPGTMTLREMLSSEDLKPEHRDKIMTHLQGCIDKAVDKELLNLDIIHMLFQAFCEKASETQLKEVAEQCMEGAPHLLSSKAGAEAVVRLLGVITAKQRKTFCKDLKGKFSALATNSVDYVVTMRLASTVDDTVMLAKTMLAEFGEGLSEMCHDKYGHKVLAWLFRPDDPRFFDPYERRCLALPAPTALKAADARARELVRTLRPQVRTILLEKPLEVVANAHAKQVLLAFLVSDWDAEVVEALLGKCQEAASGTAPKGEAADDDEEQGELGHLGANTTISALKKLMELEPENAEAPFAAPLWRRCLAPNLEAVAPTRCAALLLFLLNGSGRGIPGEEVASLLKKHRSTLDAAIKAKEDAGVPVTLAKQVLEALDGGKANGVKAKAKAKGKTTSASPK